MSKSIPSGVLIATLAGALCFSQVAGASEDEHESDLIGNMGSLQYFSHKFDLSIRAENLELADFYAHEIEETIEATTKIDEYHGRPVGQLTESMLSPAFEQLEQALDDEPGDWKAIDSRFDDYVEACNSCHQATEYGFIRIRRSDANPYMQSFAPKADSKSD